MGPPEAEWMLWAKRFQIEHNHLLQNLKSISELMVRITCLEEETKGLVVSIKHLQEHDNILQHRVHQLEEDSVARELVNEDLTERLKAKVASLENTLSRLIETEDKWMGKMDARCDRTEKVVHDLKIRHEEPQPFIQANPTIRIGRYQSLQHQDRR